MVLPGRDPTKNLLENKEMENPIWILIGESHQLLLGRLMRRNTKGVDRAQPPQGSHGAKGYRSQ